MERETGIEPAAPTLARSCSTTELFPHSFSKKTIDIIPKQMFKSQGLMKNSNHDFKTNQNKKIKNNVLSSNSNKTRWSASHI